MNQDQTEVEELISKGKYIDAVMLLHKMYDQAKKFKSFLESLKEPEDYDEKFHFLVFKSQCYLILGDVESEVINYPNFS